MLKCPHDCGWEGEPKDYLEHLKVCPKTAGNVVIPEMGYDKKRTVIQQQMMNSDREQYVRTIKDFISNEIDDEKEAQKKYAYAAGIAQKLGLEGVARALAAIAADEGQHKVILEKLLNQV